MNGHDLACAGWWTDRQQRHAVHPEARGGEFTVVDRHAGRRFTVTGGGTVTACDTAGAGGRVADGSDLQRRILNAVISYREELDVR